ncbi:MAG: C1 family peptidase [Saprospiraceae bacterium]|nr:C1 family peptidase [Saprospiraceae bacterium]
MMKNLVLVCIVLFSIITNNYGQKKGMGLDMSPQSIYGIARKATTRGLVNKAPKASSIKMYAPIPGDQGTSSTCVAWATGYAARTILWAKKNNITDKAEIARQAFSPGYLYRSINSDPTCASGCHLRPAGEHLQNYGCATKEVVPESSHIYVSQDMNDEADDYKVSSFQLLFDLTDDDTPKKIQAMKDVVSGGKPVVIGSVINMDFVLFRGTLYTPTEPITQSIGGHAMTIVGYDDNKFGGAFEVINSWGTAWGNEGFFWMKYDDLANRTGFAMELIDDIEPTPKDIVITPDTKDYDFSAD